MNLGYLLNRASASSILHSPFDSQLHFQKSSSGLSLPVRDISLQSWLAITHNIHSDVGLTLNDATEWLVINLEKSFKIN